MIINTKYIPAKGRAGSKIRATASGRQRTINYPHELSGSAVFRLAAQALLDSSFDWLTLSPGSVEVERGFKFRANTNTNNN